MADIFPKTVRSEIMRKVKSSNNKSTELALIKIFRKHKITGWRRNYPIFGKPDFTFPKKKIVVFVDGCFWHGHSCRNTKPKQNNNYWNQKITRNRRRDIIVSSALKANGWLVIRIWECFINSDTKISRKLILLK